MFVHAGVDQCRARVISLGWFDPPRTTFASFDAASLLAVPMAVQDYAPHRDHACSSSDPHVQTFKRPPFVIRNPGS